MSTERWRLEKASLWRATKPEEEKECEAERRRNFPTSSLRPSARHRSPELFRRGAWKRERSTSVQVLLEPQQMC
ncbi:hypothetical protein EYF80_018099 [Liparis tanakae]|uniref:Uncharacterized protein n=1 Tax=Liparis tanakae TaxID=230148 RepID=A0A4Z2I1F0_9TELE|nr:hypothetical protein EYF80_018099 [Liparis tanakae]